MPAASAEPRPYDKVITKDAKTKKGIFLVHQIKDKYYYEIPKSELNKDFLWVTQMTRAAAGTDRGGALRGSVIRWERYNNKIFLRLVSYDTVADSKLPIAQAVAASNANPILLAFNVEAWGKDDAAVIDAGRLLTTEVAELHGRRGSPDASRTYVEKVLAFPTSIEAEVTLTYSGGAAGAPGSAIPQPTPQPTPQTGGRGGAGGTTTVTLHHSMVKLPDIPMMPRVRDDRIGFFSINQTDFGREEQKVERRTYIARWRLEKKDPSAAVSEPVKPIVYYIDPATPKKFVEPIKRGVEAWQGAFEEAGFKKAIIAKEVPTPEQDPDFSTEDVRYTIIRWLPSTTENAMGPHIADPRSGEILNGNISVYHNIMNLVRSWYFTQVGPLDPRAQKFPLPDDLMADLIEYVVKHEVGHTLGLQHNMKASSMYPQEKMRDREWIHKMGHSPSIMDYARFNYVAQPEDKIPVADLIPGIGPYDSYAIHWGYTPIPGAKTADGEKAVLDSWSREQDKTPWLRFADDAAIGGSDPGEQSEAVGDADAVKSTALGIKNLERVANMLLTATTTEKGEPYDDLKEMYGRLLSQYNLEMGHVARIVGGIYTTNKHIGQDGVIYTPVPRERQAAAVKFLNENAFVTPSFFVRPEILRRIEPSGVISRIATAQNRILDNLVTTARLTRMQELATLDPKTAYAPLDFLGDVRKGIFKELESKGPVKIDTYRRNLQSSYVEHLGTQLNRTAPAAPAMPQAPESPRRPGGSSSASTDDAMVMFRGELKALSAAVTAAIPRAGDSMTRMHLDYIRDQIAKALDPKFAPPMPAAPSVTPARGINDTEDWWSPRTCWPDYRIDQ
jgi:hypothetical protein